MNVDIKAALRKFNNADLTTVVLEVLYQFGRFGITLSAFLLYAAFISVFQYFASDAGLFAGPDGQQIASMFVFAYEVPLAAVIGYSISRVYEIVSGAETPNLKYAAVGAGVYMMCYSVTMWLISFDLFSWEVLV